MNSAPLQFIWRTQVVTLHDVPPSRTLLQLLREDLHCTGAKEGCNGGDCGACTVVLGQADGEHIRYQAVNSCIRLAHSVHGLALWTAQDVAALDGTPHPVQQALGQCHASQCGFCTPGVAMSLFGLYQQQRQCGQSAATSRAQAQTALSGNLCRCTGYRSILAAAQQMMQLPAAPIDETALLQKIEHIHQAEHGLEPDLAYKMPATLAQLLAARAAQPQAQLVAGATDVALWINKQQRTFTQVLDLSRVAELRRITLDAQQLSIGAAVTLTDAFAALVAQRPQLHTFASRFAGLPVRNAGTLGGNVANGSPIGDSMPLLIALNARVRLTSLRGVRSLPLEQLYTGYRQNVLVADELLTEIDVPAPTPGELCRAYKISKRFEDDISAVCLALHLVRHADGTVASISIGVGGVAAMPVRAAQTQAALRGQPWTQASVQHASVVLRSEFAPISDVRASAAYRVQVLGNLLQRFWLESQGATEINLEALEAFEEAGESA